MKIALIALVLASAAQPLPPTQRAIFQSTITNRLKDPESARFKWLPLKNGAGTYCGLVNARNAFGGYAGFLPFRITWYIAPNLTGAEQINIVDVQIDSSPGGPAYSDCKMDGYNLEAAK